MIRDLRKGKDNFVSNYFYFFMEPINHNMTFRIYLATLLGS